jgi:hypothetical protein
MGMLDGKVAVVTAATSGMALATAKRYVKEGAYVFITGRNKERLDKAVREIGKNVTGVQADSSKLSACEQEASRRNSAPCRDRPNKFVFWDRGVQPEFLGTGRDRRSVTGNSSCSPAARRRG